MPIRSPARCLCQPVHSFVILPAIMLIALPHRGVSDELDSPAAVAGLRRYVSLGDDERPLLADQPFAAVALTRQDADAARELLSQDYASELRRERAAEMESRVIHDGELAMPFFYRQFGDRPEGRRSLYISMHGGGGTTHRVNDRQWENQKKLYQLDEGLYLAPRAATDAWNMWHQSHIDRMFDRLIQNLIAFEGVDPNRVYLMGYSAGGDGVYQLAPRMADRFAAAAMMAGHPNETSPLGLRNLPFTIHMGGLDSAYNRNGVARHWEKQLSELRQADANGYPHLVKIYPDKGHWMDGEDASAVAWMAQHVRNPLPGRIVWKQDDVTHHRFYWLAVSEPAAWSQVVATRQSSSFDVQSDSVPKVTILLNDAMTDLDQPITVTSGDKRLYHGMVRRTIATLDRTLRERGDPQSVFSAEVTVSLPESGGNSP